MITQIPATMLLAHIRPSRFLACVVLAFAGVSGATAAVGGAAGVLVVRGAVGVVEGPFFAAALYLFSSWYTREELAKRIAVMFAAGQGAGAFGGLLGSAVLGGMEGKGGLEGWRWLFILVALPGFPLAVVVWWVLPDYPATTMWLTEEERELAVLRIAEEANQEDEIEDVGAWAGLRMAFADPAVFLILFMQLGLNTAASFVNFFPTIVATLGYGQTKTLLLSAPPPMFAAILGIINSWHSDKTKERFWHIIWPQVVCSIGFIISAVTMDKAARYTATFMMMCVYGSYSCILSWVSTSLPRPASKRAVSYALVNAGSNLASVYASYFYPKSQGPRYWQANVANLIFSVACILLATILRVYLSWRNRQLDEAAVKDGEVNGSEGNHRETELVAAKWQCNPSYRYTL
ncbi:MFS general substrate transporter [Polyplosphaeria fusca]|uniref:MFS general substrate transporter n=1 Tax=Polyplosphaeria fusca TaxID=682080 RepID=A0A9P4R3L1_9PLEO|nr:MFS general substrate transporter [Polyplosphaeria fusca]